MEVEPWEALDLDDSDLPHLLRPCKRRRSTSEAAAANSLSQPASPKENQPDQLLQQPPPPSSTSCRRIIPGPAGAVQAAMLRKDIDRENHNRQEVNGEGFNSNQHYNGVPSTQEYIRRAMDGTAEFDDDFTRNPWLSALRFVGAEDGLVRSTSISSIKKCHNGDKVAQVVAIIKSCTPNGLGGLTVLLKDPTGTVGATIHHKVLSQCEFGKNLTIGAVLIIREVAVFAPVRSAHYLNITLRNLVKVLCIDSCSTSKLYNSAYPIQYADPGIEYCGKAKTVEMSTVQNVAQEDAEKRHCMEKTENSQNHSLIQTQNLPTGIMQLNNSASTNANAAQVAHINLRQQAWDKVPEVVITTTGDHQKSVDGSDEGVTDTGNMTSSLAKVTGKDIQVTHEKLSLVLKASLPQWTDEQLDELFAGDEDDCSLL